MLVELPTTALHPCVPDPFAEGGNRSDDIALGIALSNRVHHELDHFTIAEEPTTAVDVAHGMSDNDIS